MELIEGQKSLYEDQRVSLARLLSRPVLSELDRKRILACMTNMRLVCDTSFFLDKQTNISPKLAEFAEVIAELVGSGGHKAVVFSAWETMLHKAAEVLDRLGVGYALLHGGMQGKERKEVLERFREVPECLVFLSTDAGGIGLNLQNADSVINLELPWNPAVLEQRIARVHRLGQENPVRVVNFVTRGTIEERVLRAIETKKSLFSGVFDGDSDEISFQALGQTAFLDTVREMVDEPAVEQPAAEVAAVPAVVLPPTAGLLAAGVQMLESLAGWEGELMLDDDLKGRAITALRKLVEKVEGA